MTNTTTKISNPVVSESKIAAEISAAKTAFAKEKLVKVSIPKVLASGIGPTLFVSVNGVFVNIPTDGSTHEIPETLAKHLNNYLANLN